jgi:large conductance mechanosensitive channel
MIKEFKEFIKRGNVMDLAVGVIVGGAFSSIVTSLVNNLLTPILGIFLGGIDFSGLSLQIKDATINYGLFIQSIIDFLIIAFCIFLLIKIINRIMTVGKKDIKEDLPKLPPKKEEVILLEEIRDILIKQEKNPKKTTKKKDSKKETTKK